ncbi:M12 family metallopeptidase [Pedobacter cryoconitis]|uniref:Peptidase M12A domain-containing protein n=1 Tax=Pedobacter cryoconitis TaxID=188932 RepID=A0A7X0MJF5_9SPHI|nr:M12 family metallopeptidase [Pedobacter cryoconitis]MBB6500941.1 hypothetical protein [Pedobacter cryoconitis]
MKTKSYLILMVLFTGTAAIIGCKKNENTSNGNYASSGDAKNNAEQYNPSSIGKVVQAYYNNNLYSMLEVDNGQYLLGGDVLLEAKDIILVNGQSQRPKTEGTVHNNLWPNKTIYYKFYTGKATTSYFAPSDNYKTLWNAGKKMWEDEGFTFVLDSTQSNIIELRENKAGSAASSSIGYAGGKQYITFDPGSFSAGSFAHEIGHHIGLEHEQGRIDRDLFININWNNMIDKNGKDWTYQYAEKVGSVGVGSFDFGSIMLYPTRMTRIDGNAWTYQRDALSAGDKQAVKYWYGKDTYIATGNYKLTQYGSPSRVLEIEYRKSDSKAKIDSGVNVITDTLTTADRSDRYTWEVSHVKDGYYKILTLSKDKNGNTKTNALTMNTDSTLTVSAFTANNNNQLWQIVPGYKDGSHYKLYPKTDPKLCINEVQGATGKKSNLNPNKIAKVAIVDTQEWGLTK